MNLFVYKTPTLTVSLHERMAYIKVPIVFVLIIAKDIVSSVPVLSSKFEYFALKVDVSSSSP